MSDQGTFVEVEVRLKDLVSPELDAFVRRFGNVAAQLRQASQPITGLERDLGLIDPAARAARESLEAAGRGAVESAGDLELAARGAAMVGVELDALGPAGREVARELQQAGTSFERFENLAGVAGSSIGELRQSVDEIAPAATRADGSIEELVQGATRAAAGFEDLRGELSRSAAELQDVTGAADRTRSELASVAGEAIDTAQGFERVDRESTELGSELRSLEARLASVGDEIRGLDRRLDEASAGADEFGRSINRAGRNARRASQDLSGVGGVAQRQVRSLATLAAGYFGLSEAIQQAREGVSDFLDVDRSLAEVSTIAPTVDLGGLESDVFDLSLRLGLDEEDQIRGFYQTISAGITETAEAQFLLNEAAELGVAGVASTEEAVDLLTTVVNAYGLEVSAADEASDILFTTVEVGKTTISELATNLGKVLPAANQLRVPLDEVAAGIATITQGGRNTARATEGINLLFTTLLRKSQDVNAVLAQQGSSFDLNSFAARGFQSVLLEIREAYQGNEDGLVRLLEEQGAVSTLFALTAENGANYAESLDQVRGATEAVNGALARQLDSSSKQVDILVAGLRQARAEVGRSLVGLATDFAEASGGAEATAERFVGVGRGLGRVTQILGGVGQQLGALPFAALAGAAESLNAIGEAATGLDNLVVGQGIADDLRITAFALKDAGESAFEGAEDFAESTAVRNAIQSRELAEQVESTREFARLLTGTLAQLDEANRRGVEIPSLNPEILLERLRTLDERARASGLEIGDALRSGIEANGLDIDLAGLTEGLRAAGLEVDAFLGRTPERTFVDRIEEQLEGLSFRREALEIVAPDTAAFDAGIAALQADFASSLAGLLDSAETVGEEIPDAVLRELLETLGSDQIPALEVAARLGLDVPDNLREELASIENLDLEVGVSVTQQRENIEQAIIVAQAEIQAIQAEILAGTREEGDLIDARLDLRRLEAQLLGAQNVALQEQAARIIAAVDAEREKARLAAASTGQSEREAEAARSLRALQVENLTGLEQELGQIQLRADTRRQDLEAAARDNAAINSTLSVRLELLGNIQRREEDAARTRARERAEAEAQERRNRQSQAVLRSQQEILSLEGQLATTTSERLGLLDRELAQSEALIEATRQRAESEGTLSAELEASLNRQLELLGQVSERRQSDASAALLDAVASETEASRRSLLQLEAELAVTAEDRVAVLQRQLELDLAQVEVKREQAREQGTLTAEIEASLDRQRELLGRVNEENAKRIEDEERIARLQDGQGGFGESFAFGFNQATDDLQTFGDLAREVGGIAGDIPRGLGQEFIRTGEIGDEFFENLKIRVGELAAEFIILQGIQAAASFFGSPQPAAPASDGAGEEAATEAANAATESGQAIGEGADQLEGAAASTSAAGGLLSQAGISLGEGADGLTGTGLQLILGSIALNGASGALSSAAQELITGAALLLAANGVSAGLGGFGGAVAGGSLGLTAGGLGSSGSIPAFAKGGIMQGSLLGFRDLPINTYAFGGIANSPQLAIFGEGPTPAEAFVPLPDGKTIPVTITADGEQASPFGPDAFAAFAGVESSLRGVSDSIDSLVSPFVSLGRAITDGQQDVAEALPQSPELSGNVLTSEAFSQGIRELTGVLDERLVLGQSRAGSEPTSFGLSTPITSGGTPAQPGIPSGSDFGSPRASGGQDSGRMERLEQLVEAMAEAQASGGGRMVIELNQTVSPTIEINAIDGPSIRRVLASPEGRESIRGTITRAAAAGADGALTRALQSNTRRGR